MRWSTFFCTLSCLFVLGACASSTTERKGLGPLSTVSSLDLQRYMGKWYEIASFPQSFQRGCTGSTATYSLTPDGDVDVLNECRLERLDGELKSAKGTAKMVDPPAKLEVSFFWPFWGDYWVIDLDPDYRFAVVGHPGRDYLWILSRSPQMSEEVYAGILDRLRAQGYEVERLVRTLQPRS